MPEEVRKALDIFTDEEIENMTAFLENDGTLYCIGFINSEGQVCQFAEKEKSNAITVLEEQYRKEIANK